MGIRTMTYIILATEVKLTRKAPRHLKDSLLVSDERGQLFVYESNFIPMSARDSMGTACTPDLEEDAAIHRFLATLPRDSFYMKRVGAVSGARGQLNPEPFNDEPDVAEIDTAYELSVSDDALEERHLLSR